MENNPLEDSRPESDQPASVQTPGLFDPETPSPVDPSKIGAFFDVDQTLVRGASSYWAAKEMFKRSLFGFREIAYAARKTFRYVLLGEEQDDIGSLSDRAAQVVAGNKIEDVQKIGEEIFEKYFVPRVYKRTYDQLKAHIKAGHTVYLVSATPWIIAEEIAKRIGAAGGIGTKTKVHAGLLVGELDGGLIHGPAKVLAVQEVAEEQGLDLEQSWAYSDSSNDIPMLSLVGHPVPVNPDRALRLYAREHGWTVFKAYETRDVVRRWVLRGATTTVAAGIGYGLWKSGKHGTRRLLALGQGR